MCSSACSRRWDMKATRCACCSSMVSRQRMRSQPSTDICAKTSALTSCCISACMARSSSCLGKQTGLSAACWPERLIGALPHVYLYAANNPSEGALAKRRSAATLISYLTPSLAHAGTLPRARRLEGLDRPVPPMEPGDGAEPAGGTHSIASRGDRSRASRSPPGTERAPDEIGRLSGAILEVEYTLIPHGMHVVGDPPGPEERAETLTAIAEASASLRGAAPSVRALVAGAAVETAIQACAGAPTPEMRQAVEEIARLIVCSPKTTNSLPCCADWTEDSSPQLRAAISCAPPRSCPQGAICMVSIPTDPERVRDCRRRQAGRARPRPPCC